MIAVHGLTFTHPGADRGFSDVSFTVPAGVHAALIGTNGVGKTTLIRLLAGELDPDDGTADLGAHVRYMPQEVGFGEAERELSLRALLARFAPAPLDEVFMRFYGGEASTDEAGEVPASEGGEVDA